MTPACEQEVRRLVDRVPVKELNVLAATDKGFKSGGFRPGKPELLRIRLFQLICGAFPISEEVRKAVAHSSRAKTLTELISIQALTDMRQALAALLTPETLVVALLLDERPEARKLGEGWLGEGMESCRPLPPDQAPSVLGTYFSDLQQLMGGAGQEVQPVVVSKEAWRSEKERLDSTIKSLRVENRRLKGAEDRASMFSHKLKHCEESLEEKSEALEVCEAALREEKRVRLGLETELARELNHREEKVSVALDLALSKEFNGWLAEARRVEQEVQSAGDRGDDPLLVRAEAALSRQARTDRHSGNRRKLAARLESLEKMQARVRDTLAQALRQAPELKEVERELAGEIRRLDALLAPDPAPESALEQALSARIHSVGENELPALRHEFTFLESLKLLSGEAHDRLRQSYRKRLSALAAVGLPEPPEMPDNRSDEAKLLGRTLAGTDRLILLLDGHNVLFSLPARYSPPRGTSRSDAEKRQFLVNDLVRLVSENPAMRAWIIFDGAKPSEESASPNVRVSYSGGVGEHRADRVLVDTVRYFKSVEPDIPILLVSNDFDLCTQAARNGAMTMRVLELGAFFGNPM